MIHSFSQTYLECLQLMQCTKPVRIVIVTVKASVQMEAQRQQLFSQWEAKLSQAQEATEAANAAHTADKEAVESAASQALAAAAGETASHTFHVLCIALFRLSVHPVRSPQLQRWCSTMEYALQYTRATAWLTNCSVAQKLESAELSMVLLCRGWAAHC